MPATLPPAFIERLRKHEIVPFVGAGVSMSVLKGSHNAAFPSWKGLLEVTAQKIEEEGNKDYADAVRTSLRINKYLQAAQMAHEAIQGQLWQAIKEQIDIPKSEIVLPSLELARLIWQLGSHLVITTNYDQVMRWACPRESDCFELKNDQDYELGQLHRGTISRPTVWHLHGHIHDASSLILTPDGYSRLYSTNEKEREWNAALTTLREVILAKHLLFIGYGMGDQRLIDQLQDLALIFNTAPGPHYILLKESDRAVFEAKGFSDLVRVITYENHGEPLLRLLRELANAIEDKTTVVSSNLPEIEPSLPASTPKYDTSNPPFNVPFPAKGEAVLGREHELKQVWHQLKEGRRTPIGQAASLQGIGGLGKTQLAVEYAHQYRNEYKNGVVWIVADSDIDAQLTAIAEDALWISPQSDHKTKLDVARQRLRSFFDCLLIFDNVESEKDIKDYLPDPKLNPNILITSRYDQPSFRPIALTLLDAEDSLKLLYQEAGKKPQSQREIKAAQGIVESLGGLPLALELVGAFIQHRPSVGWEDYHDLLNANIKEALPTRLSSFTGHDADIYRTLHIDEVFLEENSNLREILDVLTWSGSTPMGINLLSMLIEVDSLLLLNALGLGVSLRLIQQTEDAQSYSIHRLVKQVRRAESNLDQRRHWVEKICRNLGDWFESKRDAFTDLPEFEREFEHLVQWQEWSAKYSSASVARLLWLKAYPPYHRGLYFDSKSIFEKAQQIYSAMGDKDEILESHLLSDLGVLCSELGQYEKSLEYEECALTMRQKLLGEEHPDIAISLSNLGSAYQNLGQYEIAAQKYEGAFWIASKTLGEFHPHTLIVFNGCIVTMLKLGRSIESFNLLNLLLTKLPTNHPRFATFEQRAISIYSNSQRLEFQDQPIEHYQHKWRRPKPSYKELNS